ncbi:MAG: hypothetical protein IJ071_03150 [Ruminococcus sp.]|nr:hypothetical protein [Ruminococcus sp.]
MCWDICFWLMTAVIAASVCGAVWLALRPEKKTPIMTPLNILLGGTFISAYIGLIPVYKTVIFDETGGAAGAVKTGMLALVNSLQVFSMDSDAEMILSTVNESGSRLAGAYSLTMAVLSAAAPVLTFGFIVSFLINFSAYRRYLIRWYRDAYIFTELNDRSLALARDLRMGHRRAAIVFTDVFPGDDEVSAERYDAAKALGAICFKKDVLAVDFSRHSSSAEISIFAVGTDESENISQSMKLIEKFSSRKRTTLYIFSDSVESEIAVAEAKTGQLRVRRVNEAQSLIDRILWEDSGRLFLDAKEIHGRGPGTVPVNVTVLGMGRYGSAMVRSLAWYGQMKGYFINIDVYEADPLAEEHFAYICPELMAPEHNGSTDEGEAKYKITIHSGTDVFTRSFIEAFKKGLPPTRIIVSLGSDERNIRAAVDARAFCEQMGIHPVIQAVVHDTDTAEVVNDAVDLRNSSYDIQCIGDLDDSFSENVVINSELVDQALKRHLAWGSEEEFWRYEYNFRSSIASAIHQRARVGCGVLTGEDPDVDQVRDLEHCRWNAYMRSIGYIYSGSRDKSTRNDLGRLHHDLVNTSLLTDNDRKKDTNI